MKIKHASLPLVAVALAGSAGHAQFVAHDSGNKQGRSASVSHAAPAEAPKPVWQQFKLDPKRTLYLDFTDASADMILSLFSRTSGITIIKDPSFKMPLTLNSAKAVNLDDAFEILNTALDLNGYELQKRGKLLVVGKSSRLLPLPADLLLPLRRTISLCWWFIA